MIIDQIFLKRLSNQSVVACKLNAKIFILIAIEFINEGIFFHQVHAEFHIGHITTPNPTPPIGQTNLCRWHINWSQYFKYCHDVVVFKSRF